MFLSLQCFSLSLLPSVGSVNIPSVFFFKKRQKRSGILEKFSTCPDFNSFYQVLLCLDCLFVSEGFCFIVLLLFHLSKAFMKHIFLYSYKPGQEGGKEGQR